MIEIDYKGSAQQLADEIAKKKFTDIPKLKDKALRSNWFMGRITDTSDMFKGTVQIATYHCSPDALR